ncbi:MAG: fasciclin domain-containing protein, partial [Armatimonadetes bacterium]|nr:fasciclin domain-containing protein [Anaerolineae bacterium]
MKTLSIVSSLLLLLALTFGAVQAQEQTIVDLAVATPDLSTLVTAVQAAGLVDVLADPEAEWTVFAPTNDAFAALPEGALDALLADTELLTRVLTYHVVQGTVTSDMLSDMMAPSMEMTAPGADLMGSELNVVVNEDGTVMVNNA